MRRSPSILLGLLPCAASAGDTEALTENPVLASDALGAGSMLELSLSLLAVLAAIFAVGWMLRRLQGYSGASSGALKVLDQLPLGTRERIVLVQAGDTQLLVGLTAGRIQALHVLDEPIAQLSGAQGAAHGRSRFRALLGGERSA